MGMIGATSSFDFRKQGYHVIVWWTVQGTC